MDDQPMVGENDALLIVDVQRDFLPGGALPVPDGDAVVLVLNSYIRRFIEAHRPIFATRDWHPPNHCSFQSVGGPWPQHCIAGTPGAAFADGLALPADVHVISKATSTDVESYSGFQHTDLHEQLQHLHVKRLWIGGLATDYCVKATAIDARRLGYEALLLLDAIRAVNIEPDDGPQAVDEIVGHGAVCVSQRDRY